VPETHDINLLGTAAPIVRGKNSKSAMKPEAKQDAPENVRQTFQPDESQPLRKKRGDRQRPESQTKTTNLLD
jgi:hypothetical protein